MHLQTMYNIVLCNATTKALKAFIKKHNLTASSSTVVETFAVAEHTTTYTIPVPEGRIFVVTLGTEHLLGLMDNDGNGVAAEHSDKAAELSDTLKDWICSPK